MGHSYLWRGGSGNLALASDWIDNATGALAKTVPGTLDAVSIIGPASNVILGTGKLSVAALSVIGDVALTGVVVAHTLAVVGTLTVTAGATLTAGGATLVAGRIGAVGAHATLRFTGAVTLDGSAAVGSGASLLANSMVLAGGAIGVDRLSSVTLGKATAKAGTLTIAAAASLSGSGRINGAVNNAGTITAANGALGIFGNVVGHGRLVIGAAGTLFAAGSVAAGATATFAGPGGTLELFTSRAVFGASIVGFAAGDAIDIASANITAAVWAAGKLTLTADTGVKLVLAMPDTATVHYDKHVFLPLPDGLGGTDILLAASAATATPLSQGGTLTLAGGALKAAELALLPGGTVEGHGTIAAPIADAGTLVASGGVLDVGGRISGGGTVLIAPYATLAAGGGVAATATVAFGGAGATLAWSGPAATMAATLAGLQAVDLLDLDTTRLTGARIVGGDLRLTDAAGGNGTIALAGAAGLATRLAPLASGALIEIVPCFAAGTRIATPSGEMPVERLRVGDTVTTPHGPRRLIWAAQRRCVVAGASELRPVRIAAGALFGTPHRDVLVSPQHALLLGGMLVPAVALVNGTSITRSDLSVITYHHIAFDTHGTVFAEGAVAETYLPVATGALFDSEQGKLPALGQPCAKRLEDGIGLTALRRRLFGPPPRARRVGPLLGHLERAVALGRSLRLEGWALDEADPGNPVELEVLRGGRPAGLALANRWRPDLDRAGLADGCCAFTLTLRASDAPITLRRRRDGALLPTMAA